MFFIKNLHISLFFHNQISILPGYYKKDDIAVLLLSLEYSLARLGFRDVDVFLYGGAGLIVNGQTTRTATQDVDMHVPDPFAAEKIRECIFPIAAGFDLENYPSEWLELNRNIETIIDMAHHRPDSHFTKMRRSGPALQVHVLNAEEQLMCKLMRWTLKGNDIVDLAALCGLLQIGCHESLKSFVKQHQHILSESDLRDFSPALIQRRWLEISVYSSGTPAQVLRA